MEKQLPTSAGLIAALALALSSESAAAAPPAPDVPISAVSERASVVIRFDADNLPAALADRVERDFRAELETALDSAQLQLVGSDELAGRSLWVRLTAFDSEARDYEVEMVMIGDSILSTIPRVTCGACNERRLVESLVQSATTLNGAFERARASTIAANCETRGQEAEPPPPPPSTPSKLGSMGYAGAALLGAGATGIAAGAFMIGRAVQYSPNLTEPLDTIPARAEVGASVVGVAVLGLIGGAVLIGFDLQREPASGRGRAQIRPQLSPTYAGALVDFQF